MPLIIPSEFRLQRSRLLTWVLCCAHLGALAITVAMPLAVWLRLVLGMLMIASLTLTIRQHVLRRGRDCIIALQITRDGLQVNTREDWIAVEILDSSFVSPWLTVLNLRLPQRRLARHVILLPDSLSADEFRRLRVWLRWGNARAHGKEDAAVL